MGPEKLFTEIAGVGGEHASSLNPPVNSHESRSRTHLPMCWCLTYSALTLDW